MKSLFGTRCKSGGKCCNLVIIDIGSTNNLVSEEMVTKLNLERLKHPKPYQIAWVQDEHKVLVSEKKLVKFHIESYHDEVLCDIISMDVCHILLGKPWQYDRKAIHDGRKNIYIVTSNENRITLMSLRVKYVRM